MVAHRTFNPLVPSSSLGRPTIFFRGVAQPGSAPVLGTGGRRFKSYHPDQQGQVVELADTGDLKSPDFGRAGSSPALATFLFFFVDNT